MQKQAGNYRTGIVLFLWPGARRIPLPGDHYARVRALRILFRTLAQTRHRVPDSRASPSRRVNETMFANNYSDV